MQKDNAIQFKCTNNRLKNLVCYLHAYNASRKMNFSLHKNTKT